MLTDAEVQRLRELADAAFNRPGTVKNVCAVVGEIFVGIPALCDAIDELRRQNAALAERVAAQSELLGRRAEKGAGAWISNENK